METKLRSLVLFDVSDEVPHRTLTEATHAGLAAARTRIGESGGVDANGSLGSAREGRRIVRIELTMRVQEGGAPDALHAERAFSEAFLEKVWARGYDAAQA